jgi:hypothetical protein
VQLEFKIFVMLLVIVNYNFIIEILSVKQINNTPIVTLTLYADAINTMNRTLICRKRRQQPIEQLKSKRLHVQLTHQTAVVRRGCKCSTFLHMFLLKFKFFVESPIYKLVL